jgi:hypothetical protein
MRFRWTVSLALVAALVTPSVARGPAFSHPPRVVDSNGEVVGTLAGCATFLDFTNCAVIRRQNGQNFALRVESTFVFGGQGAYLVHDSSDCSGQRYLTNFGQQLSLALSVQSFDTSALGDSSSFEHYYAGPPVMQHAIHSCELRYAPGSDCANNSGTLLANGYCCVPANQGACPFSDGQLVQAAPALQLQLPAFSSPFSLK